MSESQENDSETRHRKNRVDRYWFRFQTGEFIERTGYFIVIAEETTRNHQVLESLAFPLTH